MLTESHSEVLVSQTAEDLTGFMQFAIDIRQSMPKIKSH